MLLAGSEEANATISIKKVSNGCNCKIAIWWDTEWEKILKKWKDSAKELKKKHPNINNYATYLIRACLITRGIPNVWKFWINKLIN